MCIGPHHDNCPECGARVRLELVHEVCSSGCGWWYLHPVQPLQCPLCGEDATYDGDEWWSCKPCHWSYRLGDDSL